MVTDLLALQIDYEIFRLFWIEADVCKLSTIIILCHPSVLNVLLTSTMISKQCSTSLFTDSHIVVRKEIAWTVLQPLQNPKNLRKHEYLSEPLFYICAALKHPKIFTAFQRIQIARQLDGKREASIFLGIRIRRPSFKHQENKPRYDKCSGHELNWLCR
jgi:hypothetical protein